MIVLPPCSPFPARPRPTCSGRRWARRNSRVAKTSSLFGLSRWLVVRRRFDSIYFDLFSLIKYYLFYRFNTIYMVGSSPPPLTASTRNRRRIKDPIPHNPRREFRASPPLSLTERCRRRERVPRAAESMAAAQIRGSAAPATARRWPAPPSARILRFAPLASTAVPASPRRGVFGGLAIGSVYKVSFLLRFSSAASPTWI